nr:unnamed protein product [Digitaria exilis]
MASDSISSAISSRGESRLQAAAWIASSFDSQMQWLTTVVPSPPSGRSAALVILASPNIQQPDRIRAFSTVREDVKTPECMALSSSMVSDLCEDFVAHDSGQHGLIRRCKPQPREEGRARFRTQPPSPLPRVVSGSHGFPNGQRGRPLGPLRRPSVLPPSGGLPYGASGGLFAPKPLATAEIPPHRLANRPDTWLITPSRARATRQAALLPLQAFASLGDSHHSLSLFAFLIFSPPLPSPIPLAFLSTRLDSSFRSSPPPGYRSGQSTLFSLVFCSLLYSDFVACFHGPSLTGLPSLLAHSLAQ